jgi:hypothetical protein
MSVMTFEQLYTVASHLAAVGMGGEKRRSGRRMKYFCNADKDPLAHTVLTMQIVALAEKYADAWRGSSASPAHKPHKVSE